MTRDRRPVILFHSELSDPSWPETIERSLPDYEVCRHLDGVAPEDVEIAIVWKHPPGLLAPLTNLKLIQVLGAGVDHFLSDRRLPTGVPMARLVDPGLTERMTEYVLLHTLALHRRLEETRQAQREARWRFIHPEPPSQSCVGILGLGHLGAACADVLSGYGFRVIGWSRSPKQGNAFATYAGESDLPAFLNQCDILVLLLPLTAQTSDLVDGAFLANLREGSALINVARGGLIVDEDLLAALDTGKLRHAVLDVFREEPLSPEHPFWLHPKLTITPHNSSATNPQTAIAQVTENIRLALSGAPVLNEINRSLGY
jgi:glyoxylate/hydroxypyruvate reductase A